MADIKGELKKLIMWWLRSTNFFLSTLFFTLGSSVSAGEFIWGKDGHPFSYVKKRGLQIGKVGRGDENIKIEKRSYEFSASDWFESVHLSFEKEGALDDRSRRFKDTHVLVKANFRRKYYPDSVHSAASFESADHQISLIPPKDSFLNKTKQIGDFSILFLIKPHKDNRNMQIFYKASFFEGRKYGLSCNLRGKRIVFQFHNLFWLAESSLPLVEIKTKGQLSTSRFYKLLLRYQEGKAKLSLFLDSIPQKTLYLTRTGKPNGSRYIARFHPWDRSPLIIGKNFVGALDEMVFSNRLIPGENDIFSYGATHKVGSRFRQKSGLLVSKVYSMPYSRSTISKFSYLAYEPPGSSIRVYLRFSDLPFSSDLPEAILPYREMRLKKIKNRDFVDSRKNTLLRTDILGNLSFSNFRATNLGEGKYFQWKAIFYPDPLGEHTPVLEQAQVRYQENPPPSSPKNLEVVSIHNSQIVLRFSRNSEPDVLQGGRYHIYYGIRPDEALGVIRYQKINKAEKITISDKDHLKTEDLRYQNRIQVALDNQMIYENLIYSKQTPYLNYEYPFLQKDISYYFWVTSCDNSYDEKVEYLDHESSPSNHVVARIY